MKNLEKYKILDGATLKWIAMLSMMIDHFDKGIFFFYVYDHPTPLMNTIDSILSIIGRIAFPIFLFLLVEGFNHTSNKTKYISRMIVFAFLSEIPYDMFESGTYFDFGGQNMFFTLALALITIWMIDTIHNKSKYWLYLTIPITLISSYISAMLAFDYTFYGIIIPVLFYVFYEKRLLASILSYLVIIKELFSISGFILLNLYNGKRGKINKWIGYWFYPIHLLIIGIIRMYFYN